MYCETRNSGFGILKNNLSADYIHVGTGKLKQHVEFKVCRYYNINITNLVYK